jgi:hypothetical protein
MMVCHRHQRQTRELLGPPGRTRRHVNRCITNLMEVDVLGIWQEERPILRLHGFVFRE